MKFNYKNICLAALAACSVTACDLDTAPTTSLEANAVFKNLENADRVIRGSWNYIFNSGSTYASIGYGAIMINDDFAGSDVVRTTSYGYSSSYNLTNGYGRGEINDVMWDMVYDPINNCNAVIKNIDGIYFRRSDRKESHQGTSLCYSWFLVHVTGKPLFFRYR